LTFLAPFEALGSDWSNHQLNMSIDSLGLHQLMPTKKRRSEEIFKSAFSEYNFVRMQLKPDQSINFGCWVGGNFYDVLEVAEEGDFFKINAKDKNEVHIMIVPVEQIAFDIVVIKKTEEIDGWGVKFMGFEVGKPKTETS